MISKKGFILGTVIAVGITLVVLAIYFSFFTSPPSSPPLRVCDANVQGSIPAYQIKLSADSSTCLAPNTSILKNNFKGEGTPTSLTVDPTNFMTLQKCDGSDANNIVAPSYYMNTLGQMVNSSDATKCLSTNFFSSPGAGGIFETTCDCNFLAQQWIYNTDKTFSNKALLQNYTNTPYVINIFNDPIYPHSPPTPPTTPAPVPIKKDTNMVLVIPPPSILAGLDLYSTDNIKSIQFDYGA